MPKSSGVGLAGLGCAGSYPALEIPVRCHLAFRGLDRRSPSDLDARDKRTRTATRDKSPFASTEDRAGTVKGGSAWATPRGNSSDQLSLQQVTSPVDRSLSPPSSSHVFLPRRTPWPPRAGWPGRGPCAARPDEGGCPRKARSHQDKLETAGRQVNAIDRSLRYIEILA